MKYDWKLPNVSFMEMIVHHNYYSNRFMIKGLLLSNNMHEVNLKNLNKKARVDRLHTGVDV